MKNPSNASLVFAKEVSDACDHHGHNLISLADDG